MAPVDEESSVSKTGAHLKKGVYSGKPRGIQKKERGGPAGRREVNSKLVNCWKPQPKKRNRGAHLKKGVYTGKPRGGWNKGLKIKTAAKE